MLEKWKTKNKATAITMIITYVAIKYVSSYIYRDRIKAICGLFKILSVEALAKASLTDD